MLFYITSQTFNTIGGGFPFGALSAVLSDDETDFGSALEEITLTIYFRNASTFDEQSVSGSLRQSFEDFDDNALRKLPKSRFLRKQRKLYLDAIGEFASAEEVTTDGKPLQYRWQVGAHEILVQEIEASRKKFKPSDDFQFEPFLDWLRKVKSNLPRSRMEMTRMANAFYDRD